LSSQAKTRSMVRKRWKGFHRSQFLAGKEECSSQRSRGSSIPSDNCVREELPIAYRRRSRPGAMNNYTLRWRQLTQLFPVTPYGLGSTQCESVRSIILRLAMQHTVTYTVLVNFLVQQHCVSKRRYKGFSEDFWRSLLFKSPLIQAAADATGHIEHYSMCVTCSERSHRLHEVH
jgi:hypothetical protein